MLFQKPLILHKVILGVCHLKHANDLGKHNHFICCRYLLLLSQTQWGNTTLIFFFGTFDSKLIKDGN